ncbi:hypothetical protein CCACVL1_28035 [Corchorus capsularis]|uniref:Pentacotripeptide-repeat region of PRORP domain-containing protein n=1 Tax=Corchorus capsularis TaxID=210143 RepID=A0A1R3G7Q2_COCAP|nr:hypothetical protein CCACVL1_28035 [Corchorus capsularis]
MTIPSFAMRRSISTLPYLCQRIKQTENEIVGMFRLPSSNNELQDLGVNRKLHRKNSSARTLDERFIRILKIFKWGPDAEKALEVLKLKVDQRLVREVLMIDVEINVKIQFFKWAGKRRNFQHDSTTYMTFIHCLNEARLIGEMWKTIQEMVRGTCVISPADLSEIVRILGRAKMVNKALSIFYQIKGRKCKPTASTYNTIILMLMQEGHHEKVQELYTEMCNEGNCLPDTVTYSALISTFGKLGRPGSAIRLFEEMKESGLQPTPKIYTTLIEIYFKLGKTEEALGVVQEMKGMGCRLTVYTYTELIKGLGKAGRVEDAYAAYCSLINSLGKAKRYEAASELFQELKENCGHSSARVYAVMIKHFGKCGRLNEAVDLFNEMKKLGCSPDVYAYNALMSGMVRAGMIDEAHSLLRTMEENGCAPDLNSHNIILNGLARTGGPNRAMEMFTRMKNSKIKPDAVSYNTVLGCLSRACMLEEAAKLMREMKAEGFEYDLITYSSILEAVGKVDEDRNLASS